MKKLSSVVLGLLLAFGISAQHLNCGTDEMRKKAIGRNPLILQYERLHEELLQQELDYLRANRDEDVIIVIPVVWHILHQQDGANISDAQIFDAMNILNRDFRKLNADTMAIVEMFDTLAADVKIEFRLATKDVLGNCTNGINRYTTIETYQGDNGAKLFQWPRDRYLNIWTAEVINMPGVAGYSQLPSGVLDDLSAKADGVILQHTYIGSIGTGSPFRSRALTHEVGHYLNLSHTWGGTNDPEVNCGDDGVDDTPITAGHANCETLYDFECNSNFMEYSYNFQDVTTTSGTVDPATLSDTLFDNRMSITQVEAHGVSANSVADQQFAFSGWGIGGVDGATNLSAMTGAINTNQYYEFSVAPDPGTGMTLSTITFTVQRSDDGPRIYCVRSNAGSMTFNTNLPVSIAPLNSILAPQLSNAVFFAQDVTDVVNGTKITLPLSFAKINENVTFRIYAWNAESSDGWFAVDNIIVKGTYGQLENVQNYMEYSYCSNMFTEGQGERMRATLNLGLASRNNLGTATNRTLTGTEDGPANPCSPKADFYAKTKFACMGAPIDFYDNTTNGTVTSWLWTFQDGSPSTSTEQYPSVSFNSVGWKSVTLTVGNAVGSSTKTIPQAVVIGGENFNEYPAGFPTEGFDSAEEFYNHWIPWNRDSNESQWQRVGDVGFSNNTSAMLNAYDMDVTYIDEGGFDIDEMVSPEMNLENYVGSPLCSFKWAYATQAITSGDITERLQIYLSKDCGQTWGAASVATNLSEGTGSSNVSLPSSEIVTGGSMIIPFVPVPSDWSTCTFNISSLYTGTGFRMKFRFFSGEFSNNFYLDDINISGIVGIDENADFYGAGLMPNPSQSTTVLTYYNNNNASINIELADMSGRIVESWNPNNNATGKQTLVINTNELAKGVYMVRLKSNQNTSALKLLVN